MSTTPFNLQVGGTHYAAEYQHWDLVADTGMDYFAAQITKYVMRSKKKNGLQDLQKALHFCNKYLDVINKGTFMERISSVLRDVLRQSSSPKVRRNVPESVAKFFKCNNLDVEERNVVELLAGVLYTDYSVTHVLNARAIIDSMVLAQTTP